MQITGEGEIHITISADKHVSIVNTRPMGLAAHLARLTPEDALRRIALLFSTCRSAQALAGCYAIEAACAHEVSPEQKLARSILRAAEILLEHAMNVFLHWPAMFGQQSAYVDVVRKIRANLFNLWRVLYPQNDWMRVGGGLLRPDARALRRCLVATSTALATANLPSLLETLDFDQWRATATGPAAMLFRMLEENGWNEYGDTKIAPLQNPNRHWLDALLAVDHDLQFIAQPNWQGVPQFTGALARQYDEPLIKHARIRFGCGLATHLLAHCVEIERTRKKLFSLCARLKDGQREDVLLRDASGIAIVQAARGTLVHRVEIQDNRLQRYQVLAPTEWNFHPRGIVATALQQESSNDLRPAHLFIAALDPCVAWKIERKSRSSMG